MFFPWAEYDELVVGKRNTLQIFITNRCNLHCEGCFARKIMGNKEDMTLEEYCSTVKTFQEKGGQQINLLGGEPLIHPKFREILGINRLEKIKTTVYTNGYLLDRYNPSDFNDAKLRVSLYCESGKNKSLDTLPRTDIPLDVCFMVSKNTTTRELLNTAQELEGGYNCDTFFISSLRELDNPRKEFFDDTAMTMPVMEYKELVHNFLKEYNGKMEIHVSKRGVFESTKNITEHVCRFANYAIGGKIVQCPYDLVNEKYQKDYEFGKRNCQQNNSCLMSKVAFKRKE